MTTLPGQRASARQIDTSSILAPAPRTETIELAGRGPVPVTLLTGFLGAGKKTLLNRILNGAHGLRVGVLVNDFGDINIDAELVKGVEENTISLVNGCVCCEIRDDLVASLEELLVGTDEIDYVVLEASGVAEPGGIAMTFMDKRYGHLLRLDSITCLVDAEGIFRHADDEALNMLKLRQIGFADLVVLNKVDLVSATHVEVIREWVAAHMQRVRIVESSHGDVPMEILLAVGRFDPAATGALENQNEHGTAHGAGGVSSTFDRWSYRSKESFSLPALRRMVQRELPESVYRCKGIVRTSESPDRRHALQVVGRRTQIVDIGEWRSLERWSEIVAIGSDMDEQRLDELFDACRAREFVTDGGT